VEHEHGNILCTIILYRKPLNKVLFIAPCMMEVTDHTKQIETILDYGENWLNILEMKNMSYP